MANSQGDGIAFATPRSSTCIVLNCILFITVLDFCCVSIGDLTRDCLVFLKDRQVSNFGCFVFDSWVLRFRVLGASFSSLGCFVFEFWVLHASVFVFECFFFRNYRQATGSLCAFLLSAIVNYNIARVLALYKSYWADMNKIFIYARPCVNKMTWAFFFLPGCKVVVF